jgi:hypothetical protein
VQRRQNPWSPRVEGCREDGGHDEGNHAEAREGAKGGLVAYQGP